MSNQPGNYFGMGHLFRPLEDIQAMGNIRTGPMHNTFQTMGLFHVDNGISVATPAAKARSQLR